MEAVRLIVRIVAQDGKAAEVKGLLRKMVGPTRAERGCRYYEFSNRTCRGFSTFMNFGTAKRTWKSTKKQSTSPRLSPRRKSC
jgi:hypothetical protein